MRLYRLVRTAMIVLVALLVFVTYARADDLPALHRVTGVAVNDVLNIREEPSAASAITGFLRPDERRVEITALSADGSWGQVNTGERAGWSHMRFLERESAGSWRDGETALVCFGTEPFWNMPIFLPTHRAEFFSPAVPDGEGGFELVTDTGALPGTRFPPVLAIPFSGTREGAAILRGEACNDGMSDMTFGISAFVYWRGDTEALSGCCRLD